MNKKAIIEIGKELIDYWFEKDTLDDGANLIFVEMWGKIKTHLPSAKGYLEGMTMGELKDFCNQMSDMDLESALGVLEESEQFEKMAIIRNHLNNK